MMLSWGLIYGTNSHIYDHLSMRQNWNFDFWFQYLVSWFQYLIFQNQVLLNSLSEWPGSYVLISSYLFVLYFCLFFFRLFTSTFESILHWGLSAASLAPPWEGTIISLDLSLERRLKEGVLGPALVEKWLFQNSIQLCIYWWEGHQKVVVKVVTTPRFSSKLSSRLSSRLFPRLSSRLSLKLSSISWELKMLHLKPKFAVRGSEVKLGGSFVDPVQPLQEFDEKCQLFMFLLLLCYIFVSKFHFRCLCHCAENVAHPYFYPTKLNYFLISESHKS